MADQKNREPANQATDAEKIIDYIAWRLSENEPIEDRLAEIANQGSSIDDIKADMILISTRMGLLAHGSDYLSGTKYWNRYQERHIKALADAAAKVLNLDDSSPLLDKETRTDEQQQLMLTLSAHDQLARLNRYLASNYFASQEILLDCFAEELDMTRDEIYSLDDDQDRDILDACAKLNPYYYAMHKEIHPAEAAAISEEGREELRGLVKALISYKNEHGGSYLDCIASCFLQVGDVARITEITQRDFFDIPISKVWREQSIIAAEGAAGREINVGNKSLKGAVIVEASISGKDGEPLVIDQVQQGVQRAIGNLIFEAGGAGALPIIVTPQQIYRAYARLPSDATVSQQQAEEMERAVDAMMYAPSSINFRAQLERHKRIKQQPDYDYQDEHSGKIGGPLVPAQKLEDVATRDGSKVIAYKILAIPVFYQYSHIIGQIARVKNKALTGGEKNPIKTSETRDARGTARNVAARENVLTRILRMIERQKNHKSYIPIIRVAEVAEDCGITLTRQSERTLLKNIRLYLEELKAQGEHIKDFSEVKEGRKLTGFEIKPKS